jgi:predicted nuclease of restriction endonuclease-like (RecB) superfamily
MQTLDELVGKDAQFDLIKQDVQGAEIMIMKGAPEIFTRAKYVIQEVNKGKDKKFPDMPSENEMDEFMFELGFDHNEVIEQKINVDQIDKIYF